MADDLAARRHPARDLEDEPRQRIGLLFFLLGKKIDAEQLLQGRNVDAPVGGIDLVLDGLDLDVLVGVVLVGNVADDDLDQILDRNEPLRAAILVDDDGEMVWLACIFTRRSVAGIDGGTNSTSRLRPACFTSAERSAPDSENPASDGLSLFVGFFRLALFAVIQRMKSFTWIMPATSSSVSR